MKLELTEKDIFLLKLAFSVLILFMTVRFLIMPQLRSIQEGRIQKEELLLTKEEMETVIDSIPSFEQSIETRKEVLAKASGKYYDVMENRQVDEILTGTAVEAGLFPVSLSITGAEPGIPEPYLYSVVPDPAGPVSENYVLTAGGNMVLRGRRENIFRFMDMIEETCPAVQVRALRLTEQEYMDADWNVVEESVASFQIAVYMCRRNVTE